MRLFHSIVASAVLAFLLLNVPLVNSKDLNNHNFQLDSSPDINNHFEIDTKALCNVAENSLTYLNQNNSDTFAVHAGKVFNQNLTLNKVKETLTFICKVEAEDKRLNQPSRLKQKDFLQKNFNFYRWTPDKKTANNLADKSTNTVKTRLLRNIPNDEILLTKYYTKLLNGSELKTDKFSQALYALPYDERALTLEEANDKKSNLTRYKYTRQEIINGALLNKNLAMPLIWLTEDALHDVLLQGTGVLLVNGKIRYFNVHRNNGINYNYAIGKKEQARYWYFAEVPNIMGYGKTLANKIAIKPQVSFAGNVAQLGLAKLILVNYTTTNNDNKSVNRMGILADQGGAFDNNLFQLDFLVDSYKGWNDYYQANKHLPDYAKAWILVLKE